MSYWQILGLCVLGLFTAGHLFTTFFYAFIKTGRYGPVLLTTRVLFGASLVAAWIVWYR